jgi:hypothetical protein
MTATPETATPRAGPSPAEVNRRQQADAEQVTRVAQERQAAARDRALATSPSAPAVPAAPAPALPATSEEAFERNLSEWGSLHGTPLSFNGQSGEFQSGGETKDVVGHHFVAHMDQARREWIKFNGDGVPPTLISVGIYEDARLPSRDDLGDPEDTWPINKFGQPDDPWKLQYRVPLVATDESGEIFELTNRGLTAVRSFEDLIRRYGNHPQRKKGLVPLIELVSTTYPNKRLGTDMPKAVYKIVGWVERDGSAPVKKPDPITSGKSLLADEMNDEIPFA